MAFEGTLQEITVRMHGNETRDTRIEVQQGDTASRKVRIWLKTFGGADYIVPYGARAVLCISKNDGKKVYDECEIEDKNVLLVTLSDQAISCSGLQKAQIYIFSEEGDIKTQVFQVNVPKAVYSDDAIESSDEFGILHELIVENSAIQQAEQIRIEAEATRTASEEKRQATMATMATATEACLAVIEDARAVAYARGNAIVQTASGEIIVIDDSSDDQLRGLRVFGKTEQFTTTGAQLFELKSDYVDKTRGLQVNVNEDGSLTVNGIPNTFYASCYNGHVYLEPGTYFVSGGENKAGCVYAQITKLYADGTSKYISNEAFVVDGTESAIRFNIQAGLALDEVNNYTIYPMLNAGDTALPYEPYTGGIPSPNPQYPQEIVSVGDAGNVEVGVYGRNLFDETLLTEDNYEKWFHIKLKPNTAYTFSTNFSTNDSGGSALLFFLSGNRNDGSSSSVNGVFKEKPITQTTDSNGYVTVVFRKLSGTNILSNFYWQLEEGTAVTPYEPFHKQTLTALTPNGLPGIKVSDASLATYTDENGQMWCSDEVDLERGVYVQRIGEVGFDGTESNCVEDVNTQNLVSFRFRVSVENNRNKTIPIASCTHYQVLSYIEDWTRYDRFMSITVNPIGARNNFVFADKSIESLDKFKDFLAEQYAKGTPLTVKYVLATPIETPLSESELAQYASLHSNYPVTTVLNDSDAHMEVKYNADTKTYIDNKFAELKTALVALGGN